MKICVLRLSFSWFEILNVYLFVFLMIQSKWCERLCDHWLQCSSTSPSIAQSVFLFHSVLLDYASMYRYVISMSLLLLLSLGFLFSLLLLLIFYVFEGQSTFYVSLFALRFDYFLFCAIKFCEFSATCHNFLREELCRIVPSIFQSFFGQNKLIIELLFVCVCFFFCFTCLNLLYTH